MILNKPNRFNRGLALRNYITFKPTISEELIYIMFSYHTDVYNKP